MCFFDCVFRFIARETLDKVYYLSNMSNILKRKWLSCTWLWFFPISVVLHGVFHYSWPMFKVSVPIMWQTEWCNVKIQIIRADVVGIAPFQIFYILCIIELLTLKCLSWSIVCCRVLSVVMGVLKYNSHQLGQTWSLSKIEFSISIIWQAGCCDVKCQIIRAYVVGIAPFQIFYILCIIELLTLKCLSWSIVCCRVLSVVMGVLKYNSHQLGQTWSLSKIEFSISIIWQAGCCDVKCQIIRAYVVGIAPFQIFYILCIIELLTLKCLSWSIVCCRVLSVVMGVLKYNSHQLGQTWSLSKIEFSISIIWQAGCCDVKCQIIRAYVVGIAPFQIFNFCSIWNLLTSRCVSWFVVL